MKRSIHSAVIICLALLSCSTDKDKPDAYGTFEATEVTISSQATGRILWLKAEEGQVLDSNQLVGMVDTTDLHLKKSQSMAMRDATSARKDDLEAQIAVLQQTRENVLVDKARIENLLKDGAATRKQMDDITASLNLIEKQISSVKSQFAGLVDQVNSQQKQTEQIAQSILDARIINPIRGTVLTKFAEPDEITTYGKPLYKIANLDEILLRVYMSGAQLPHIKIGQTVEVRYDKDAGTNSKTTGEVSWISQTAEFTPKTIQTKEERVNLVYAVKVRVKNDGTMKIGMPGEIKLKSE
jgi:HlyD family secretion protein